MITALELSIGGTAIFAALFLALRVVLEPAPVTRLTQTAKTPVGATVGNKLSGLQSRASRMAAQSLDRHGKRRSLEIALERADLELSAGDAVLLVVVGALGAALVGLLVAGPLGAVLVAVFAVAGAPAAIRARTTRRQQRFEWQLPDLLQLLSGNLRVGHGLLQAIDAASHECEEPTASELGRVASEVRLGRDVTASLEDVAERVDSVDFRWVAQAVAINREVGGDLAEVFDTVGETIRARAHLARQVQVLSAEGRLSAYVLIALPFVVGGLTAVLNPGYMSLLVTRSLGIAMLLASAALMTAGALWLRRLIRPVY